MMITNLCHPGLVQRDFCLPERMLNVKSLFFRSCYFLYLGTGKGWLILAYFVAKVVSQVHC